MNRNPAAKKRLLIGVALIAAFAVFTFLIQIIDVQPVGLNATFVGFASINRAFHQLTGVHMTFYALTDWLSLIPLAVCAAFAGIGLAQWRNRRSIVKVDADLLILGAYYLVVMFCYAIFERVPVNYRPVLINGVLKASYPSSTTLLVLCVMPTLAHQADRRVKQASIRRSIHLFVIVFSAFMVIGRLISGVHWLTDIIGSVLMSAGLLHIYLAAAAAADQNKQ